MGPKIFRKWLSPAHGGTESQTISSPCIKKMIVMQRVHSHFSFARELFQVRLVICLPWLQGWTEQVA